MLDKVKSIGKQALSRAKTKKKDTAQHLVALDIGTEFVKALIGQVANDKIEILGVGRARQALTDMQAGAISDIAAVVANCDKALNEAEQQPMRQVIKLIEFAQRQFDAAHPNVQRFAQ